MLIRQKAGWRLHHQAYLWPKRYKSSPSSALALGLSNHSASSPLSLNSISPSLSSSSKRKTTSTKRTPLSRSNRQQREREAAKRRHARTSKTLAASISNRRISSNGSDGVPSPTSPSSSSTSSSSSISSSSSPSPRKLSRGHLELPWFLGSGPCMLKPWEEPFLDSSDEEDQEETIAIRLRRHTRKRRSSGQEHDSNNMAAVPSSSIPSQKPTVPVESDGRIGETRGVVADVCSEQDLHNPRTGSPAMDSQPQETHSVRSGQETPLSVRTRAISKGRELRSDTPISPVTCNQFRIINASSARSERHSNLRGSKNIGNNVVIVINNSSSSTTTSSTEVSGNRNHILSLGDSTNCRGPKNPECSRGNGISRARRAMGVLYTDKHPGTSGEECDGTSVASPRPASLPSLPPSPESSGVEDTSPGVTTSPSFNIAKSSRQQDGATSSRKRSLGTAFPEAAKEQQHVTPSRRIRAHQRFSSEGTFKGVLETDNKDTSVSEVVKESSEDCYLTLALSPEETGDFLVHPSVTVTVFSGVGGSPKGLTQLQQLKELACKDCTYCRDRLNDLTGVEGRQKNIRADSEGSVATLPEIAPQQCDNKHLPPCCLDNKPVQNECCQCELYAVRHHCQNEQFTKHSHTDLSPPTPALTSHNCALSSLAPHSSTEHNLSWQSDSLSASHKEARLNSNRPENVSVSTAAFDPVDSPDRYCNGDHTFPVSTLKQPSVTASTSSLLTDHRQHTPAQENISTSKGSTIIPLTGVPQPSNVTLSQSHPSMSSPLSLTTSETAVAADEDTKDSNEDKLRKRLPKDAHRPALSRSSSSEAVTSVGSVSNRHQGSTCASSPASPMTDNSHCIPKSGVLPPPPSYQCRPSSLPRSEQRQQQKLGKALSSLTHPASHSHSPSPASPSANTAECKWHGCKKPHGLDPSDLLEHIRQHAEEQIANKAYACLWSDCKVFNKPSWSGSWLERHIVTHSGHRPFKCILDNCGQRFHSQAALERHVNSHFGAGAGGSGGNASAGLNGVGSGAGNTGKPGGRSREEMGQHRMTLKRKRQLKRRCMQTVRKNDFFDEQSMAAIRQDLIALTSRSRLDVIPGAQPLGVTFHRQVVGRRTGQSGAQHLLMEHSPPDILEDMWISQEELQKDVQEDPDSSRSKWTVNASSSNSCKVEELCEAVTLPLYVLPAGTVGNLHTSVYRTHRFRQHRRK